MSTPATSTNRTWFKWYHLYYFLAAFDVLTISASLYLNHTVLGIYSASVDENSEWSNRVSQYSRLNELAAAVNAPGNDAFDSGDIVGERLRLAQAYRAFQNATAVARNNLRDHGDTNETSILLGQLNEIDTEVLLIQTNATAVFSELKNNRQDAAGSRMAEMDRCFSRSLGLIGKLCEAVRQIQSNRFDAETARAQQLGRFEFGIAGVVCLILFAVTWYGHKMADHMRQSEAEVLKARKAAETASHVKGEFLANMSHEIRTPMTAILGFTEILLGDVSKPEHIDSARTIKENGEYLLDLINDILDLSKIESGKLNVEQIECSPHEIVAEVSSLMRVRAKAKGLPLNVQFDGAIPDKVHTDPTRLRQILINVVGNAIKFTEAGSIRIVTRLLNHTDEEPKLQFDVIDTGIGIAAENIEQLFKPFTQADGSTTRKFGGTGLGLSITKRLAELLGGEVSLFSTVGRGTTFSITVCTGPLDDVRLIQNAVEASAHGVDAEVANEVEPRLDNCRILLSEDGPDNQRLIGFILRKAGADVTLANNGQVGLDLATAAMSDGRPFDAILMDMQMPVLDGYAATRRLRDAGYMWPIIALTAHAMASDREKCLDAGCDDYSTKPIIREKLIELLASYVKQPGAVEEAVTGASSGKLGREIICMST